MNAVIVSGGKQYRVAEGQRIKLETIPGDVGQTIEFDQILMLSDGDNIQLGAPLVAGAKIQAEIIQQGRHKKIEVLKFRRRKHHMKQMGHRQNFTEVKILGTGSAKASAKKATKAAKVEE